MLLCFCSTHCTLYGVPADVNAMSGWDSWYKLRVILCGFSAVEGYL